MAINQTDVSTDAAVFVFTERIGIQTTAVSESVLEQTEELLVRIEVSLLPLQ